MVEPSMRVPFNDLARSAKIDEEARAAAARVLEEGWYLFGSETEAFEREFASYVGVPHVVSVANGTDALELALAALVEPGGEVVLAANAGGYGAVAAARRGLRLVYADVNDTSVTLTRSTVEEALSPKSRALVITHLYGQVTPLDEISELCRERGIVMVEDCAQSVGARLDGQASGSTGDAATFSFYPTKNLGAMGDAGAVVTGDARVAERVRALRQYGWEQKYEIARAGGCNSRMDEVQAAVLRVRLRRLDDRNARRRSIASRYRESVAGSRVHALGRDDESDVAHLAVLRVPDGARDKWADGLRRQGIGTAIHYPTPDHRQRGIGDPGASLPVTERVATEVLSLPCFPELGDDEVDAVCTGLRGLAVES